MQTRTRNPFTTIHTEGALLPSDLLQRVLENDSSLPGLSPEGYHLSGEKLNEAINRSWNRLQGAWAAFRTSRSRLNPGDAGTTLTRERWLLPLFDELDYGRLQTAKAVEIEGKSYPISHGWGLPSLPIHLVGCGVDLERRAAGVTGASKASPHSLMQEFLNRSPEAQWGLVSNGLRLRVLRDNASLTRQAFLEFDLEAMFEGEVYSDFVLLWLMCHQSRFETGDNPRGDNSILDTRSSNIESRISNNECILEQWSKAAQEQGTRALEQLREGVQKAIEALGQGFLRAPANQKLRADLRSGALSTHWYYRQLLRLVYRLLVLFVAEDRDLLFDPSARQQAKERYLRHYSLARLRRMAERMRGGRHADLYAGLRLVTDILGGRSPHPRPLPQGERGTLTPDPSPGGRGENVAVAGLGLSVLGGFLFAGEALPDLESAELENESLLSAIRHLTLMDAYGRGGARRAVDYKNLGARELGSVYESLLELHPLIHLEAATFALNAVAGSERKTTGSFYTPEELIAVLLDSALEPVIAQALDNSRGDTRKSSTRMPNIEYSNAEARLLNLKICDPACGSGHFLLAAARRLARRLAQVRTGESEPTPEMQRAALREVISQCIYGVDINPMSVELCKVSLWMEALEPGKPLSFLDAHIQCGDSLVGVAPQIVSSEWGIGSEAAPHSLLTIPDEAFNPAFGDDKATSSALKKRNKAERGGQMGLDVFVIRDQEDLAAWMARRAQEMDALPDETAEQVGQKAQTYREYLDSPQYRRRKQEYDLWTAAFFWKMEAQPGSAGILAPTQEMLRRQRSGGTLPPELVRRVEELARRLNFLHWELAFPKVFAGDNPGFDCVLGNPPWDMLQLDPQEYFSVAAPEIAKAASNSIRERLISELENQNTALYEKYLNDSHTTEAYQKFVHDSGKFRLTSYGRINLMSLFAELGRALVNSHGRLGIIVPTGIATDSFSQYFIADIVEKGNLVSLFDFENREGIFPAVDSRMKFCLLTLSGQKNDKIDFCFFATKVSQLFDPKRRFRLSIDEILLFNPNSKSIPVFRTTDDANITRKIYKTFPVLVDESKGIDPWGLRWLMMYLVNTDSGMFRTETQLISDGFTLEDKLYKRQGISYVPMYEGRMVHVYNHRYATWKGSEYGEFDPSNEQSVNTQYWVPLDETEERLQKRNYTYKWLFGIRRIARNTDERTVIGSLFPRVAATYGLYLIMTKIKDVNLHVALFGNVLSLVFDYLCRGALTQPSITFEVFKQLPILPPSAYAPADIAYIAPRVLELVYTAYDLRPFAEDMWNSDDGQWTTDDGKTLRDLFVAQWEANRRDPESQSALKHFPPPESARFPEVPFVWNETRRAQLRAELDAYYARLYGLTRDELRYILDPKEVHGEDFPGETFRVLKEKEIRLYGEFRTRRLVLEAWDGLEGVPVTGYQVSGEKAVVSEQSSVTSEKPSAPVAKPENRSTVKPENVTPKNPAQPMLSDFGLYKCVQCGKMVMGYEKDNHVREVHKGVQVEWTRLK